MRKKKSNLDFFKEIRRSWTINPRTRIRDNSLKDKKKIRQAEKKMIKDELEQ